MTHRRPLTAALIVTALWSMTASATEPDAVAVNIGPELSPVASARPAPIPLPSTPLPSVAPRPVAEGASMVLASFLVDSAAQRQGLWSRQLTPPHEVTAPLLSGAPLSSTHPAALPQPAHPGCFGRALLP